MSVVSQLQKVGLSLSEDIGLIKEVRREEGWVPVQALVGKICQPIPAEQSQEVVFDPAQDIALLWTRLKERKLYVIKVSVNSTRTQMDGRGLVIECPKQRIRICQSESFIQSVCELWRNLSRLA